MANVNDMFPSKYLKCADLKGRAHELTMERIEQETLNGEPKFVLYFADKEKGLVLNKTNAMMISSEYGNDTEEWRGHAIVVYPDKTMFQGKPTECIRVRPPQAPTAQDGEEVLF